MPKAFDVAILGGGPAGCVTAMLLARRGISVAILDKSPSVGCSMGETLPPQATQLLAHLGLFEEFQAQQPRPSPGIVSIWGSSQPLATDFLFSPHGCGWHIDRPKFNAMLLEAATRAGATIYGETRAGECVQGDDGWCIFASSRHFAGSLNCRLLVDATGRSPAGAFGFPRRKVLDRMIAVAGTSPPARGACPSDYTLVEAADQGWFYSALLPCGEYVLAYMTDADVYAAGRSRSNSYFAEQLAKAPHTLERIEQAPPTITVFSAVTSVREKVIRRNWLAVGDAARSYDPLSGLGLWSALSMASESIPVITDLLEGGGGHALNYEDANREALAQYKTAHRTYYGLERRWPKSEFWRRRLS